MPMPPGMSGAEPVRAWPIWSICCRQGAVDDRRPAGPGRGVARRTGRETYRRTPPRRAAGSPPQEGGGGRRCRGGRWSPDRTSERGDGDGGRGWHRRAANASGRPAGPQRRRIDCAARRARRARRRTACGCASGRGLRDGRGRGRRRRCGSVAAGLRSAAADSAVPARWTRLAVCWELAHRHGLAIATLMRTAHREFVERDRFESRFTAAMAGARTTALVLAGLPVLGVGLGQLVDADPVHFLLSGGLGGALLV